MKKVKVNIPEEVYADALLTGMKHHKEEEMKKEKQLKRLRYEKKVKLSVLELGMITIGLSEIMANIDTSDRDGEALLGAYIKLHKRLCKECKE
jgi:hypothetical protein